MTFKIQGFKGSQYLRRAIVLRDYYVKLRDDVSRQRMAQHDLDWKVWDALPWWRKLVSSPHITCGWFWKDYSTQVQQYTQLVKALESGVEVELPIGVFAELSREIE